MLTERPSNVKLDSYFPFPLTRGQAEPRIYEPRRDNSITVNPDILDLFFRFIYERHQIYCKRFVQKLPAPWTNDRILRKYKFTNVYRELDRGTLYLTNEIIGRGSDRDVIFNILLYRIFNNIETYRAIGFQTVESFDAANTIRLLESRSKAGKAIFTNAFMVSGTRYADSNSKIVNMVNGVIRDDLVKNFDSHFQRIKNSKSLEDAHAAIKEITHFGDFLSYEAIIDINYSGIIRFSEDDWVNPGPGCKKGINYIFSSKGDHSYAEIIRILREDQHIHFDRLNLNFKGLSPKDLTLRNIEHSLCEFSKYYRLFTGQRTHARKFVPSDVPLPLNKEA
ncbi:MAG: nucleotide kinase domain-containing protein [Nitrososphaerales archaeon]